MTAGLADQPDLPLGAATVRPSTCEVLHRGERVSLEPQVMRAFLILARQSGRVVSRDALVDEAWDGRSVSEDAINRVISRIRRLSETTGAFRLVTLRKVGYRVEPSVALRPESPDAPDGPVVAALGRAPGRSRLWAAVVALTALAICGALVWRIAPHGTGPPAVPTVAVLSLSAAAPEDAPAAARLTARLRTTLSHMRGLRLVDDPGPGGKAARLVLSGAVTHAAPQPIVTLRLNDERSGARVWEATFDGRPIPDPTVEERAVSGAARYLAIWLGDRMAGEPAAREPPNPEVSRIVAAAQRTLAAAHEARHNRDWPLFARLAGEAAAARDRALAIDPGSADAMMLGYNIEAVPEFRRPEETEAMYAARRRRAAQLLSRALAANPDDAQALAATAREYTRAMRWDEAGKLLERAVAVNPNSADANTWYAYQLGLLGQCQAGLRYARIAAGLIPDQTWRRLAVPRLLNCAHRRAEAEQAYRTLLDDDPANVFVLHDLYLMFLAQRDAARLRAVASDVRARLWRGARPVDDRANDPGR
jgi:DNA-binding winged helix-turn-helix (wHTH) protein